MMSSNVVISAEGLGKKYLIGHESAERSNTLRDALSGSVRKLGRSAMNMMRGEAIIEGDEVEEFWALRNLDFEIRQGDVVGVIGRNGAGKSTLLKILSRITEPSEGRVSIRGRVASLLEVGTGFHPELSGRENIFLNGAILGMGRGEIRRKFDEIVAFSEVERFLDTPVKRYSSGMYVRLAFAVAAHLEPEILIVDEVLAVGDAEFQKKCLGKMQDVAGEGRTVIFVSHNMAVVQALCTRGLFLQDGNLILDDSMANAVAHYSRTARMDRKINLLSKIEIESIIFELSRLNNSDKLIFSVELNLLASQYITDLSIIIRSPVGHRLLVIDLRQDLCLPKSLESGKYNLIGHLASLSLLEIEYIVDIYIGVDGKSADFDGIYSFTPPSPSNKPRRYNPENLGLVESFPKGVSISKMGPES